MFLCSGQRHRVSEVMGIDCLSHFHHDQTNLRSYNSQLSIAALGSTLVREMASKAEENRLTGHEPLSVQDVPCTSSIRSDIYWETISDKPCCPPITLQSLQLHTYCLYFLKSNFLWKGDSWLCTCQKIVKLCDITTITRNI